MPEVKPTSAAPAPSAAAAKEDIEKKRSAAEEKLDAEEKARHDLNVAKSQAALKAKPTPTQRESDLARLGALDIDDKEDDGSGPDPHDPAVKRAAEAAADAAKYKNREMTGGKK